MRPGKILRGTLKTIADGDAWQMLAIIDDPAILDESGSALKEHGVSDNGLLLRPLYA